MSSGISLTVDERGVGCVTIDRPEVGNSLTPSDRDALTGALHEASESSDVRAVLLRATGGRHFCAGPGISSTSAPGANHPVTPQVGNVARTLQDGWQRLIVAVLDCAKPVVTAVEGTAAGAGASLVLASDLVVMSETATLVEAFVRRGIMPDAGSVYLLTRIVGLRRATELLMLGDAVSASDCERFGIVNRVVQPDAVRPVADELAARLAAGPTVALAMTKKLLGVASESSRERAFSEEAWAQENVSRTDDLREGIAAFAEGRKARFLGR